MLAENQRLDDALLLANKALEDQKEGTELEFFLLKHNISVTESNLLSKQNDMRKEYLEDMRSLTNLIEKTQASNQQALDDVKSDLNSEIKSIKVQNKDFTGVINEALESTVSVITNTGQGSGVVVSAQGFIVTNYHVINDASWVRVLTYGQKVYNAEVIAVEKDWDIAVLKVDIDLPVLSFANSNAAKVGEKVIALGNPEGFSFSVTEGIISAVDRTGPNGKSGYLQTDVPLNPGNSGGPLVNAEGRILGITNFKIGGSESLGFAIPANTVSKIVDQVVTDFQNQN